MFEFIKKYLGWRKWSVLTYNSIFENLFIFLYIALARKDFSTSYISDAFVFLIFSLFSTSYGYLINDLADLELDKIHGKDNTFIDDSIFKSSIIVLCFLIISILLAIPFFKNNLFLILFGIWIFLTSFYSLKPLRFKERGKIGLVLVVLAQRVLPIFVLFSAFSFYKYPDVVIFAIYIFSRGLTSDMNHQIEDYTNDLQTNTKTSAVTSDFEKYRIVFFSFVEVEKIFFLIILILASFNLSYFMISNMSLLWFFSYFIFLLYFIEKIIVFKEREIKNPYAKQKSISQVITLLIPNIVFPVILSIYLVKHNPFFSIFIVIIVLIFRLFSPEVIKNSFIVSLFMKIVKKTLRGFN